MTTPQGISKPETRIAHIEKLTEKRQRLEREIILARHEELRMKVRHQAMAIYEHVTDSEVKADKPTTSYEEQVMRSQNEFLTKAHKRLLDACDDIQAWHNTQVNHTRRKR